MSNLFNKIKGAAVQLKDKTVESYHDLWQPPQTVPCSKCQVMLQVPAGIFDWICPVEPCRTVNKRPNKACTHCKAPRPVLPDPILQCANCQGLTTVPSTNAMKHVVNAKTQVVRGAVWAKDGAKNLVSKPQQFNCEHCMTLLAVPPPAAWKCAGCSTVNEGVCGACVKCTRAKEIPPVTMVLCGVCGQPTKIPALNLVNKFQVAVKGMDRTATKLFYDARHTPYVECPRPNCRKPISLESKTQESLPEAAPGELAGAKQLVCPSCKEVIIVPLRANAAQPSPAAVSAAPSRASIGSAPSPAVVPAAPSAALANSGAAAAAPPSDAALPPAFTAASAVPATISVVSGATPAVVSITSSPPGGSQISATSAEGANGPTS